MAKKPTLLESLIALPLYTDHRCADKECVYPACIRHPATGKFYCSTHAIQLAESHKEERKDIIAALQIRQRMLKEAWECAYCDKPAERSCAFCRELVCFSHMNFIPRTGCACPDCAEAMERQAEADAWWG